MDVIIEKAKDLGRLIQQDARLMNYEIALQNYSENEVLQNKVEQFEEKRQKLISEAQKEDKDVEKIKEMDKEVKGMYSELVDHELTVALNDAKSAVDELLGQVNKILRESAEGMNPDDIDLTEKAGCSPSGCAGCSGC